MRNVSSLICFLQTHNDIEYMMLTPDRCLIFPSVDYVRRLVTKHSMRQRIPVVIDCSHIYGADFTAAQVIESLTKDFASRDQPLYFYNLKPSVCSVFEGVSPVDFKVVYTEDQLDLLLKEKTNSKNIFGAWGARDVEIDVCSACLKLHVWKMYNWMYFN